MSPPSLSPLSPLRPPSPPLLRRLPLFLSFVLLPSSFFLFSCSSPPRVTLSVPFAPQAPNHCGPTVLLMAARFYGLSPDPDALSAATYVPALSGSTPELLLDTAHAIGLSHSQILPLASPPDPAPIFDALSAGHPVILLLAPSPDSPTPLGHFVLATGCEPSTRRLRVHSGARRNVWLPPSSWLPRLSSALLPLP